MKHATCSSNSELPVNRMTNLFAPDFGDCDEIRRLGSSATTESLPAEPRAPIKSRCPSLLAEHDNGAYDQECNPGPILSPGVSDSTRSASSSVAHLDETGGKNSDIEPSDSSRQTTYSETASPNLPLPNLPVPRFPLQSTQSVLSTVANESLAIKYHTVKRSKFWLGFRRAKELDLKPHGSYFEALNTFRTLSKPLRVNKFRHMSKAARTLAILQEAAADPYPPEVGRPLDIGGTAGKAFLTRLQYFFRVAFGMYRPANIKKYYGLKTNAKNNVECLTELITGDSNSPRIHVIVAEFAALVHRPAFCLFLDHQEKRIVLALRGSTQFSDICTDLQCDIREESLCHEGMERAADWFDVKLRSLVDTLGRHHPDYDVCLCGHSLGGGVASLLLMRWVPAEELNCNMIALPRITCYSFGAPCICTHERAKMYRNHIISVSCGRDMVTRISVGSLRNAATILNYICANSLKKNKRKMKPACSTTLSTVGETSDDPGITSGESSDEDINRITRGVRWREIWACLLTTQNLAEITRDVGEYLEASLQQRVDQIFENTRNLRQNSRFMATFRSSHRTFSVESVLSLESEAATFNIADRTVTGANVDSEGETCPQSPKFEDLFERKKLIDGDMTTRRQKLISFVKPMKADSKLQEMEAKHNRRLLSAKFSKFKNKKAGENECSQLDLAEVRAPLHRILKKLRRLELETTTILVPAGHFYLLVPAWHYICSGSDPPLQLTKGGCVLMDIGTDSLSVCRDVIFRRRALHDHYPNYMSIALGIDLPLTLPDELAVEMDRLAQIASLVIPQSWELPHNHPTKYKHLRKTRRRGRRHYHSHASKKL